MKEKISYMSDKFEQAGFTFSDLQKRQFYTFYNMLIDKNKVMNLTGITEFTEVVEKHFLDSIYLNHVTDLDQPVKIIDLGTGAGFPGIPLKIAFPEIEITLVDSLNKRIHFIEEVIEELGLTSIYAVHARAEELARNLEYREKFDLCVSRAVANLSTLEEYCLPFVHIGGKFISYKSGEIEEEVQESKKACFLLGGKLKEVYKFDLEESKRSFVVVEKVKTTPKTYPRKAGTPSKMPLK
ncbi:16S rRNA (guanine(527)-N(7))-methyltransferase RsmG [Roseburia sp. BX1005]|uniref:Ribosomal RNA small subunit methyltransferase G n=1 Tax=Roseburia zhanii TaxID=2763064 RepID=A0A923LST2_9FIRM|nr:16S rRNA (guanine(527)-N(7))-methyltransferase RsmG [Roseburia zhanii]MBC5715216.1 16S rRNA (guanine(527)-N(7))-methyltransferase RsmG [Roseburia zhanii]